MKSTLFILLVTFLVISCDSTSNNLTMPTESQDMAKTVDDMDAFVSLSKKGRGPFEKTTGDIQYQIRNGTKRVHCIFNAHNLDAPNVYGIGKGKMTCIRSITATGEIERTRGFNVTYVSIVDHEGWFVCQCTYDTLDEDDPYYDVDNWFIVYVEDIGEPGSGNDRTDRFRLFSEDSEGFAIVDVKDHRIPPRPRNIEKGNIQVHQYY
ncbi:hypothetical protein ACFLZD_02000 [Candidatus Neomarinimicrobiota bacterium]